MRNELVIFYKSILELICSLISGCIPKAKNMMVFGAWYGEKFADNPKYLFIEAQNQKELHPVWITRNKKVYDLCKSSGYEVYLYNSFKGIWLQCRAKYIITCTGRADVNAKFTGRAVHIELWHGVPLKKILSDDKFAGFRHPFLHKLVKDIPLRWQYGKEYVISTSDTIREIYKSAFRITHVKPDNVLLFGQPRNDIFYSDKFSETFSRETYYNKKVILYMPTHRKEGAAVIDIPQLFDLRTIEQLCEKYGYVFLVKKHFYHREEKLELNSYKNIFDLTGTIVDSQELLKATDILITDYSSCYIDFLLLNRSMIFYDYDYEAYINTDREMYFNYEEVTPGYKVKDSIAFMKALNEVMEGKDPYEKDRMAVRSVFYHENACRQVGPSILKGIKNIN